MNAVDTNIFLYRVDFNEPTKQAKARTFLRQIGARRGETLLLWQVAGELAAQLRSWRDRGRISSQHAKRILQAVRNNFPLQMPNPGVLDLALDLSSRHSLSHWDSMLLAACIDARIDTLYTEDVGAPRKIDSLNLINPLI